MMEIYMDDDFQISPEVYIARSASLHGKIHIDKDSSVWDNAVIRADLAQVLIGEGSSVQDNVTVHVDTDRPSIIGDYVTIGHNAVIHGAEIGNNTIIGMGAIVLNGAKIGINCIVGAGSVITEKTIIPDNSLVLGIPGKVIRTNSEATISAIRSNAETYIKLTRSYLKKYGIYKF